MAVDRKTPAPSNTADIDEPFDNHEFYEDLNAEIIDLGMRACYRLTNVGGTANDITADCEVTLEAYGDTNEFLLTPTANNTGAATISIDGLGALDLNDADGNALVEDALVAGRQTKISGDGTEFRLPATGDSSGFTQTMRRNALLSNTYLAEYLGTPLLLIAQFADGYADTTGINTGSSTNYYHNATTKRVVPSYASSLISAASGTRISDFDTREANAFDSTTSQANSSAAMKTGPSGSAYIGKTLATAKRIAQGIYTPSNDSGYCGGSITNLTVNLRGKVGSAPSSSADGVLLGTTGAFNDTTSAKTILSSDVDTVYDHVWFEVIATSGTDQIFCAEAQFYEATSANNMTLITATQTAGAAPSFMRVLADIEAIDAITLNTDLTVEVTRDGGATWTLGSLTEVGVIGDRSIVEIAEVDVRSQPSGTSLAVRFKTLNNKDARLGGLNINWR